MRGKKYCLNILKFRRGSSQCHHFKQMGESGEIPLTLKGRQMALSLSFHLFLSPFIYWITGLFGLWVIRKNSHGLIGCVVLEKGSEFPLAFCVLGPKNILSRTDFIFYNRFLLPDILFR